MPSVIDIAVAVPYSFTGGVRRLFVQHCRAAGLDPLRVRFLNLSKGCVKWKGTGKKKSWDIAPAGESTFQQNVSTALNGFSLLICCDPAVLKLATGKYTSLHQTRGSVYTPDTLPVPMLVFDDITKTRYDPHFNLTFSFDVQKALRWSEGKQLAQPPCSYTLVANLDVLREFEVKALAAAAISMDVETSGNGDHAQMTVSGYSILSPTGQMHTYVVPFVAPWNTPTGNFWTDEELEQVLLSLRKIHASDAIKFMQMGVYDSAYYTKYRLPVKNYFFDTAVASHAMWVTMPKRLAMLASFFCDYYQYWKDQLAESATDDAEKSGIKVPQTKNGFIQYCRYNAQDCHYTLLVGLMLAHGLNNPDVAWAKDNFLRHMRAWIGPAFRMTMTGANTDEELRRRLSDNWQRQGDIALQELKEILGSEDFNPNSPKQVAALVYDFIGSKPLPRKGKSSNATHLDLVATQGALERIFITRIIAAKQPRNNVSKYGFSPENPHWSNLRRLNGRFLYSLNPIGTTMERYASKQHHLWVGTNIQNVPAEARSFVIPSPGYVLIDVDYEAADAWFTAYSFNIRKMIDVLRSEKDTHCLHASEFFQRPYDEIHAGQLAGDDWVVHSTRGIRQNTKRIVYGANYLMAGYTMLITMGRAAVVHTALALGHSDASAWSYGQLTDFCQSLIDYYFNVMYPGLREALSRKFEEIAQNGGVGTAIGGFTRRFFGAILSDNALQREAASFFGQAGTARHINVALDKLYYKTDFCRAGGRLLFQVHDSLVCELPENQFLELAPLVQRTMQHEAVSFTGETFVVPTSISVGYSWGKKSLVDFRPDLTLDELKEKHEIARQALMN